ncbi:MAG: sigma 54-dependent Fis family transcriptional regulator [Deltaproteobacteria bacterium]|nr:sigma 54-dependent Fis family transcriptional regulator [Deltaproteobacteria bacterium]
MKRITLYHQGSPVTHHSLHKNAFSIGADPENDLVLAAEGVAERHLVIYCTADGRWRARPYRAGERDPGTELDPGIRIALGPYSVEFEPHVTSTDEAALGGLSSAPADCIPDLGLVGVSAQIHLLRMEIARHAAIKAPVLIIGETGTGKELVASGLHTLSRKPDGPFVPINCASITDSLLEDILFGHERGAFTGAGTGRKGVFEQARGGTLFLDEIGELPLSQQSALLRVLDDKKVRRIGAEGSQEVDFRLVAATNLDLLELTKQNKFRVDLYHRIAALGISTTPLRFRSEDVEPLARHFLAQMAGDVGERRLSPRAVDALGKYPWPGNARELRNALYRAAALSGHPVLEAPDFDLAQPKCSTKTRTFRLEDVPDTQLNALLRRNCGNVAAAAREIGVPRTSLRDRLRRNTPVSLAS